MTYAFFTGASCSLLLLAIARIAIGHRRRDSRWLMILLAGIFIYLLRPLVQAQSPAVNFLIDLPTILIPAAFWLFAHQLCAERDPFPTWGWTLIALELMIDLASQLHIHPLFYVLAQPFKIGLIVAGIVTLLQQLQSDLVTERRQLRVTLLIAIGGYMVVVVCADFLFSYFPTPVGIPTLHAVLATTLAFGACLWLLALSPNALEESLPQRAASAESEHTAAEETTQAPVTPPMDQAQRALMQQLNAHMENGGYRHTGLTIRELAEQLGSREHILRALINKHLGFRNFNEYLNQYRINEASRRLADANEAHLPVLSIALDIGYRSLSPFNAAFRRYHDCTPTEFRRQHLPV